MLVAFTDLLSLLLSLLMPLLLLLPMLLPLLLLCHRAFGYVCPSVAHLLLDSKCGKPQTQGKQQTQGKRCQCGALPTSVVRATSSHRQPARPRRFFQMLVWEHSATSHRDSTGHTHTHTHTQRSLSSTQPVGHRHAIQMQVWDAIVAPREHQTGAPETWSERA